MNYTIVDIGSDGTITVKYDIDGKTQMISGMPVDTKDNLLSALSSYGKAYQLGIKSQPVLPKEITDLINTTQSIS